MQQPVRTLSAVCVDIERGDIDVQAGKNCLDFLKQQRSPIEAC